MKMQYVIQKLSFRLHLTLAGLLLSLVTPLFFGGVAFAALPSTATWTKNGYVSYNGKTYSTMQVQAPGTQNVQVYFLLPAEASSSCPTSEIIFPKGNDFSGKIPSSATYVENSGAGNLCAQTKSKNISFTNTRPSTASSGTTGLEGATQDGTQQPDFSACTGDSNYQPDPALCDTPCKNADHCNLITRYANPIINKFLAPLAIIAVIIGVIWGSILYITSGGDAQKVAQAKDRIQKALVGLLAFIFLYALLNWLIPGGLL